MHILGVCVAQHRLNVTARLPTCLMGVGRPFWGGAKTLSGMTCRTAANSPAPLPSSTTSSKTTFRGAILARSMSGGGESSGFGSVRGSST